MRHVVNVRHNAGRPILGGQLQPALRSAALLRTASTHGRRVQKSRVSQRGIRPKNRAFLRDARAEARRNHGLPPFGSLLAKLTAGQATTGASTTQSELYNQLSPQLETEQATKVCAPRGERYLELGEVHIETDVSS